jgi:hypothetical protein
VWSTARGGSGVPEHSVCETAPASVTPASSFGGFDFEDDDEQPRTTRETAINGCRTPENLRRSSGERHASQSLAAMIRE